MPGWARAGLLVEPCDSCVVAGRTRSVRPIDRTSATAVCAAVPLVRVAPRGTETRGTEARDAEPRVVEPRVVEPRVVEPRDGVTGAGDRDGSGTISATMLPPMWCVVGCRGLAGFVRRRVRPAGQGGRD